LSILGKLLILKMKKIFLLFIGSVLLKNISYSQRWSEMMQEPGRNFYEIQAAFNEYWKDKDVTEKGKGYKQFKRWEKFMEPRVYPSGNLSLVSTNWKAFEDFRAQNQDNAAGRSSSMLANSTWTAMGPFGSPTGSVFGTPTKAGRDNFITFHPTNAGTFYCGTPAGSLWVTTNNGASWAVSGTDYLPVIGCNDLAIDPINPLNMYLATGDGEGNGDTYCIGVLKSIDGGQTWNTTGLTFAVSQQRQMRRLIINPSNPQVLIAVCNIGIYRTTDGGNNWTQIQTGNFYDVEFKPTNPNVVFAASNAGFYRSTNGGASFTQITSTNGVPTGTNRMSIAVTPNDTNYVYILASKNSNSGLQGVYRSTNGGSSFSTMCTTPDILSNPCNASSTGGQGWYDLTIAASPLNKDEVVVGGVNVWRSTNGGSAWTMIGCWNGSPFVHADIHELEYTTSGTLYVVNDGGVSVWNNPNWTDLSTPRNIAQIYKIGLSALSPNFWMTGHQDNGSSRFNGTNYVFSVGGDGMDCFIDRTNNSNLFASLYNGAYRRSTNGGFTWSSITTGLTGSADWVSPWKQDPQVANTLYAGYSQMFISTNLGSTWAQLPNTGASGFIVEFAIAPSNNQVIYIIQGTSVRKTIDGGNTWTNAGTGLPGSTAAPQFITIDPNDPDNAWIVLSGYSSGNKIFQTNNGGASWTNISYNLPNLPANCSVYQPGTNDRIYIGMDVGVYTKDNSSNTWVLYNNGLPNVPVNDMEISPALPNVLVAATYGRGVYEVGTIQPAAAPTPSFAFTGTICPGVSKPFMDLSSEAPTSWTWAATPSTGVTFQAAVQNPTFTFANGGTYTLSFISANSFGPGTTYTQAISVGTIPTISISGAAPVMCIGDNITLTASGASTYSWYPGNIGGQTYTYTSSTATVATYTVNGKSSSGCVSSETVTITVSDCVGIDQVNSGKEVFAVYPNPASNKVTVKATRNSAIDIQMEVLDVSGKLVLSQDAGFKKDKNEAQINISSLSHGVYFLKLKTSDGNSQQIKLMKE
jgi:photosystem II stability/assembly factor-like uncharacterized protein